MGILDFIFPKKCLECGLPAQPGEEGRYICWNCVAKVGRGGVSKDHLSIFKHEGVIRKAIISLKYKFSTEIVKELAEVCVHELNSRFQLPHSTALVPVPLHWYRQNLRGFNQSEEVGKLIALQMGWKFVPDLLIKNKPTKSQVELKGSARRQNLRGVFAVSPDIPVSKYPSIVIFDDVYTTGSTLNEAMRVIRPVKVWGLTIAR